MSSPIFQCQIMEFQFESEMSALCSTAHCSLWELASEKRNARGSPKQGQASC